MKKHAIVIIGLVLAVLVFGSCGLQKGGIIRVTNLYEELPVTIYITKGMTDGIGSPPNNVVKKATIAAGKTGDILIDEDGTYYIRPFYTLPLLGETAGRTDPITAATAILALGNTVSVKVRMITE
jgi:hypothetical protein